MDITTGDNNGQILFTGVYSNPQDPIWAFNNIKSPANLEVSTLTVNSYPAGNILLTHNVSSAVEYNAPILFQRPATDIHAPVEALQMNTSVGVPTKLQDGEYITALKTNQTVYDDIAVAGLQIFGNQTVGASSIAYIDGIPGGDVRINVANGALAVSSLKVSTLFADTVVSTTSGSANSYTASIYMSTPILYTGQIAVTKDMFAPGISTNNISTNTIRGAKANFDNISTNYISTNDMYASTINVGKSFVSSANISSLNAGNFGASRIDVTLLSSLTGDITFNLVSTLSLFGNVDVNLGLGNQLAGLIGGAASQGLGVALGGAALATGAVALITGRTSGGVNSNVFQTVNGTTQLQFSTIGTPTTSVFLDTNSSAPGTTPALQTSTTINVPAGAYCVRSVSDPLNINNNVSTIQSFGQWVPIIQGNPTLPSFTTSTLTLSSLVTASAGVSSLSVSSIGGNVNMSSIQVSGNISSTNANATFTWGLPGLGTTITNTTVNMPYVTLSTLNVLGDTQAKQVFGLSGNFNTVTGSNQVNGSFITGSNWVSTPALTVSSINGTSYPPASFVVPSTFTVSTLIANSAVISSLSVSSIGGNVRVSSIQATGSILSVNPSATLTWGSPGFQTILSQTSTVMGNARAGTMTVVGDTFAQQVFGLSGNFNTVTGSNQVNGTFITGSNWISTPALTVSSINGSLFPAPAAPTPSTLLVSSINAFGNITANNISTTSFVASGLITSQATANFSSINLLGDINTSNALARANFVTLNTSTLNASSISSRGGVVSSMVVSSLNGQPYPPPNSGLQLPSTIFLSTVNINGNLAGGNPSATFGWPGAPGLPALPSTIIGGQGITTSRVLGLQSDFSTMNVVNLNVVGGDSRIVLGNLGQGGNIVTDNPNAVAGFANLGASTMNASTIIIKGNFGLPSTIIGYQGITTSRVAALQGDFSTLNGTTAGITSNLFLGGIGQGGDVFTTNPSARANFVNLGASTISTTNLNVSGSINGNLNINGFTTMGNLQANGIAANSLTASNTIQGDVLTGRVIQATENLTAPLMTLQNLNVQQTANISTGVVSSLFTQFINNLPYPPQVGITGATPSTMYASTVFIDGGLTVRGLGQNFITRANISSLSSVSVTGLLNASTILFNGGMTNTGGLPIITSNLSATNIQNVLFINGQVYPPPVGSVSLQSTLFLSTVNVNGGLNMSGPPLSFIDTGLNRTNGNIYATSGTMQVAIPEVGSPGGSAFTITAGSTLASTLMFLSPTGRVRFTSSMTVRDAVPVGSPSQAYITTYVPGSEAPAGSVITANVSTPIINTSSIIFNGSGARIDGGQSFMNIYSDEFNIWNSAGNKSYLNIEQGTAAGYVGSTFYTFGNELATPNYSYLTAGNYWTYPPGIGNPPSGQVVTSNISTVDLVASTITANNVSSVNINVSTINNIPYPDPFSSAVSGNLQLTPAQYVGTLRLQPGAITYLTLGLSVGSASAFGNTLTRYGQASVGSAQVTAPVILSASTLTSTASVLWGFTHTSSVGSLPATQAQAVFLNDGTFITPKVVTTLGAIGLPNQELLGVFGVTGLGFLCIQNLTSTLVTVEGAGQYLPATTAPYGI